MPVRGAKPKPDGQRRRRNLPTHDWAEVVDQPFMGGPKLPAKMPNGMSWPAPTRRWWATVSSMPHCGLWSASDWEFAFDTAFVAALFHMAGRNADAAELRNREKVLGTTADFRRDLRIRYVDPDRTVEAGAPAPVTDINVYRDL